MFGIFLGEGGGLCYFPNFMEIHYVYMYEKDILKIEGRDIFIKKDWERREYEGIKGRGEVVEV